MASKRFYIVSNPVNQGIIKGTWKYHFYAMDETMEYECGGFHTKKSYAEEKIRQLKQETTVLLHNYSISRRDQTPYLTLNDQTNVSCNLLNLIFYSLIPIVLYFVKITKAQSTVEKAVVSLQNKIFVRKFPVI